MVVSWVEYCETQEIIQSIPLPLCFQNGAGQEGGIK